MTVRRIQHFIDGQWADSRDGATFESITPIDNSVIATVARGGAADADLAVQAARRAFDQGPWPRLSPAARKEALHRAAALITDRLAEFAAAETLDMGKPITESITMDVPRSAYNLRFFGDFAEHAHTQTYAKPWDGVLTYTLREPAGVVACIAPWNFPLMLATWKIAPALAYGNTVVLKPAEQSPLTAALLAQVFADAGLPDGVFNVVQGFGPGEAGQRLTEHPGVDLITFTGESATGRAVLAQAAPTLKRCSFELGGKSPAIVMADADLDRAVPGTIDGMFRNQGEVCLAGSRLLVHRDIYAEFCARYVAAAQNLVVGDPRDAATQIGPMVSAEHLAKVMSYVDLGHAEGAKLLTGGERVTDGNLAAGNYLAPTVFAGVDNSWRIACEEIFGPVQVITPFEDVTEAIALANDSRYGLAGQVWTTSLDTAHRVAREVRTGTMWVNCFFVRDLRAPFGGMKDSGIGREGGLHSEEFFTEAKAVVIQFAS